MPKPERELFALRHTTVSTRPGTCYGQTDVGLAASYPDELQRVRPGLAGQAFARILCSPLSRCQRLAHDLGMGSVETDARLLELSFGQWEGLLWSEIPRAESEIWTVDVVGRQPPQGESYQQLIDRVEALLQDPQLWRAGDRVLLVTHAGVIRALHHLLNGVEALDSLGVPIGFGEWHRFAV